MIRRMFGLMVVVGLATMLLAGTAMADTQYFPGTGTSAWGKTYRNNYVGSGCYDHYGSTSSCYQGTWSTTDYPGASWVTVADLPQIWVPTVPGNYGGAFYWQQENDIENAGAGYATVSSDYESLIDHRVDVSNKSINGDADTYTYVYTYDE
ncbi:MAG TPA: hypothetical protein VJQ83_09695 [Tepidiformaceae bacterium]|nr:hypothetical protein [Tepidiformaceae bacterium]